MKTLVFLLALGLDFIGVVCAYTCINGLISGDKVVMEQGLYGFAIISFIACMSCRPDFRRSLSQSINRSLNYGIHGIFGAMFSLIVHFFAAAIIGVFLIPCFIVMHVKGLISSLKF